MIIGFVVWGTFFSTLPCLGVGPSDSSHDTAVSCSDAIGGVNENSGNPAVHTVVVATFRGVFNQMGEPEFQLREVLSELRSLHGAYADETLGLRSYEIDEITKDRLLMIRQISQEKLADLQKMTEFLTGLVETINRESVPSDAPLIRFPSAAIGLSKLELTWASAEFGGKEPVLFEVMFPAHTRGEIGKSKWLEIHTRQLTRYLEMEQTLIRIQGVLNHGLFSRGQPSYSALLASLLEEFDFISPELKKTLEFDDSEIQLPRDTDGLNLEWDIAMKLHQHRQALQALAAVHGRWRLSEEIGKMVEGLFVSSRDASMHAPSLADIVAHAVSPYVNVPPRQRSAEVLRLARYHYRVNSNFQTLVGFMALKLSNLKFETNESLVRPQIEALANLSEHFDSIVFGMELKRRAEITHTSVDISESFVVPPLQSDGSVLLEYLKALPAAARSARLHESLQSFQLELFQWRKNLMQNPQDEGIAALALVLKLDDQIRGANNPGFVTDQAGLLVPIRHDDGNKLEFLRPGEWLLTAANQVARFAGVALRWLPHEGISTFVPTFDVKDESGHIVRVDFIDLKLRENDSGALGTLNGVRRHEPTPDELAQWDGVALTENIPPGFSDAN